MRYISTLRMWFYTRAVKNKYDISRFSGIGVRVAGDTAGEFDGNTGGTALTARFRRIRHGIGLQRHPNEAATSNSPAVSVATQTPLSARSPGHSMSTRPPDHPSVFEQPNIMAIDSRNPCVIQGVRLWRSLESYSEWHHPDFREYRA